MTVFYVQFGQSTVAITCHEAEISESLGRYFRHCLSSKAQAKHPIATYDITPTDGPKFQLWRNGELVQPAGVEPDHIFGYLTYDVMARLVGHARDMLVFHAAGVALNDVGVILAARSGSGKSTLAAWLVASGFDFLTDELTAVSLTSGQMYGMAYPIVLKAGSEFVWQHWLGTDAPRMSPYCSAKAFWADADDLRPGSVRETALPRLWVFPKYEAGAPFTAEPISPAAATMQLMYQMVNFKQFADHGFAAVTRLARQIPAYALTYSDLAAPTDWLRQKTPYAEL